VQVLYRATTNQRASIWQTVGPEFGPTGRLVESTLSSARESRSRRPGEPLLTF